MARYANVTHITLHGLTSLQKSEKVDLAWLRKLALNFEKRISKNTELRAKFESTPQKYVATVSSVWWISSDISVVGS